MSDLSSMEPCISRTIRPRCVSIGPDAPISYTVAGLPLTVERFQGGQENYADFETARFR